ncbi:MAG: HD domain-containing protein [Gemmatimonadetes bacterium]|nr:HD domain-containing protein [Gemmatimonadota bacterium]
MQQQQQPMNSGRAFYVGLLEALTRVMGTAQGYLRHHGRRTGHLARLLAEGMGLSREEVGELLFACVIADLGMIGLVEDAWENPTSGLDPDTRARVLLHPLRSEQAVHSIPHLQGVAPIVRHHHEWWDGGGYPDGLAGADIPLTSRILRLADTVTALAEMRPHRGPIAFEEVQRMVVEGRGREFCPDVTRAYLELTSGGPVPEPEPAAFRRNLLEAADRLLPEALSPLSGEQLLEIMATVIDAKDPYTAGHSRRVAILAVAVANQLGLDAEMRDTVWAAGFLHDLGKLCVPLRILTKQGPLSDDERETVCLHVHVGAGILEEIPSLKHLTTGARYHHERWDGGGYPEGLSGERIPLVAQILAVCDAYDAMTSHRAYRRSRPHADALEEIARVTGRHFGPRVAASFLALPDPLFDAVRRARFAGRPGSSGPTLHDAPAWRTPEPSPASG